jgi:NDP-sugar pyrophosphorylase family protein
MFKRAIILAGGKGIRLKPYTIALPKPLVPIGDMPILEIIINQLKRYGFNHITITLNHMADIIKAFCGDGSRWNIKIDYSMETKQLSTMGPLTLIPDLPEDFLVMNGDVLTDLDFNLLYKYHIDNQNNFTIASYKRIDKIDYGVLNRNSQNKLTKFDEKPSYEFLVSMGVYVVNKKIIRYIPKDTFFGFDHLMNMLISKSELPSVYEFSGRWLDIGRPDDYEKATSEMDKKSFY